MDERFMVKKVPRMWYGPQHHPLRNAARLCLFKAGRFKSCNWLVVCSRLRNGVMKTIAHQKS